MLRVSQKSEANMAKILLTLACFFIDFNTLLIEAPPIELTTEFSVRLFYRQHLQYLSALLPFSPMLASPTIFHVHILFPCAYIITKVFKMLPDVRGSHNHCKHGIQWDYQGANKSTCPPGRPFVNVRSNIASFGWNGFLPLSSGHLDLELFASTSRPLHVGRIASSWVTNISTFYNDHKVIMTFYPQFLRHPSFCYTVVHFFRRTGSSV